MSDKTTSTEKNIDWSKAPKPEPMTRDIYESPPPKPSKDKKSGE